MSDQLSTTTNVVFIDAAVPDYQTLIAGLPDNSTYFVLDAQKDGVEQIEQYLAGYSKLDSIQILSHGSQGSLFLGNAVHSNNSLKKYQDQLTNIGSHLKDTGDILLYGCNVAQGDTGLLFVDALAKATGADVAASNDITGSVALGGDWLLETNTGSIEAAGTLSANTQATYAGSLVTTIPLVTITAGITPVEAAAGSFLVTLDSPAPVGGLTINYSLSGSATLNTDYTVAAGSHVTAVTNSSFTIAEGQTTASLTINAAGVDGYDPNETVDISLHAGSGYSFVSNVAVFDPKADFDTGLGPFSVSVGDINGDGKVDLAVANSGSNTVSVFLCNASNSGFEPKVDIATDLGSGPYSVSVGDFNGDGKADLAVANTYNSNTVSVLLRNAANTGFDPKVDFATGSLPISVSCGDFNGDGKTDLAVANVSSNTVSVLLRNIANTGFDPKVDFATGITPLSVSVGDFNGDGKTDLVVANRDGNTVSVLLRNTANSGFEAKVDLTTGLQPYSVSVADFNGDGKADLAVANRYSNTVSVLLRNAANTGFDPKVDFATGSSPYSVSVGDFNGDGKADLAVVNLGSDTVSVLLRNIANTGFDPKVDFATGITPLSVSVGDFNGDGRVDLTVANGANNTVSVLLNNSIQIDNLTITDTHINTPPQLPVITPSIINSTLSAADSINPFNAGNYFDSYTPTGFVSGTAMSLTLSSTAFDAYLQVIRNGSVLAFNDDSNGTTNSLINYTYQTGDKIYASSSDGGLVTGVYSLNITGTTIPAFEVLTTLEDTPVTLTTTMLPITDLEQKPDQLTYTLATLPIKGILSKAGINLSAGGTFTQADVDNGLIQLTPKANLNGTDSFTFSVADGLGGVLANQTFAINITPVNDASTLTAFAAAVASGNEDNSIPVTFANLQAQGDEADVDGTVTAFVVKGVSTGSLKIGASADTATAWSAGSNDVIDDTHLGYWTPEANANGILNAFSAVAKDNSGLESVTPVQASISVAEVPDVTVIAAVTPIEGGVGGAFKINLDSPAPLGGLTINYSLSGTANLNNDYTVTAGTNITAVTAGSFTIAEGQTTARLMLNAGNDGIADPNETVSLYLMTGAGYQFSYAAAFAPKVDFDTGFEPVSVSVGDFNGDGKLDLAVTNGSSATVSVLLRNAANTGFDPKVAFATGSNPFSVSVGDFNGDGKLDLAVANYSSNTVSVLLRNTANTGFDPKVDFDTGSNPFSVSVGDFDGDGKADLAVANYSSNTVSVLLRNTANTGFDPKVDFDTGSNPHSVSVGDFNGDGKLDLAVANFSSNTVSVLLRNTANTGFDPKVDFATGSNPFSVSVGDFNGDGKLDLAVANFSSNTVSVLLRNAANTGFDPKVDFATGSNPLSVSVGDFNGDGKADLAVANFSSNTVSVLLRNATNTGFDPKVDFATDTYPESVSVGDFNGDGKADLAVANYNNNTVSVLLNSTILVAHPLTITDHNPANIAPTLTAFASTVAIGNEDSQIAITFADLQAQGNEADVDGTVDAFVIKAVSTGTLLIGVDAAHASAWDAVTNNTVDATHQAYWTPAANANGTLNAFAAVAKDNGGLESLTAVQAQVSVTAVNDIPTFTAFTTTVATGNEDSQIAVTFANLKTQGNEADVDGTVDAFVIKAVSTGTLLIGVDAAHATAWNASTNNTVDATHIAYWMPVANANGTLNAFTAVAKDNSGLESVTPVQASISVAEVPDVTVITGITPVEGGAAGTFKINLDSPAPVGGLTINYTLSGTATLNTDYTVTAGANITAVTAASFTVAEGQTTARLMINAGNEGIADPNETVTLNLMTGTGYQFSYATSFAPKIDYDAGIFPYNVSVGDFNGDGKPDLAVTDYRSNTVSVLLRNIDNTGFDPKVDYFTAGKSPGPLSIGDFNGDGKTDLAVVNYGSLGNWPNLSVLLRNAANTGFEDGVILGGSMWLAGVKVGDFNGDGKTDLAVADNYSNLVKVLLLNVDNSGYDLEEELANLSPGSVSVGDFNGDGKVDLAGIFADTLSVFLRNAANTGFETEVHILPPQSLSSVSAVSVGDFNGDGKADLACVSRQYNTVSVLLRNIDNTGFDPKVDFATGMSPESISVGDFNSDGKTDLAVTNYGSNTVSVLLRNIDNNGFEPKVDFATGSNTGSLSVGDFNGDGKPDLAVVCAGQVSVMLNSTILPTTLTITDHNPADIGPTFTAFASTIATGNEDNQITVTLASLQTQGNEADVDGTVTAFVIKAVSTGTLLIGTSAGTATAWNASTNNTVDATHIAYWTAAANAYGSLNAFTAVAKDNGGLESLTAVQAQVSVTAVNDIPTFTAFTTTVATGNEDSQIAITFANLQAQGNEADVDGTVTAFVIKAVSTGTLLIGTSAGTATAWNASTNNTVDATHIAYWMPVANANGTLNAFTAVAKDNGGLESLTAVQAQVSVSKINDLPTGSVTISGTPTQGQLLTASNTLADADGLGPITYTWYASGSATPIGTGNTFTLLQGQVGKTITVKASYTDLQGTTEVVSSSVTSLVSAPANLTLTGTANIDTLTGGAGNDIITGLGAIDKLDGKDGSDL
jgi:Domain of unknown function (DUF4347)/FG-GAP-like repeat/Cadherin-like/FG-GAP repeat